VSTAKAKVKAVKIAKATKAAKVTKAAARRSPVKKSVIKKPVSRKTTVKTMVQSVEPSLAVKIIALMLILLGYAAYRFYPIATVNGQVVSRIRYYQVMETQLGTTTLSNLVTEALILDAASQQNLVIPQADIDAKVASVEAQIKSQGMDLTEALAGEGLTLADLQREIKLQLIVENLGGGEVVITEAQIDTFLAENQSSAPAGVTGQALRDMAKAEIETQAKRANITTWLTDLKDKATIIYR
jgi:hypothetical protein